MIRNVNIEDISDGKLYSSGDMVRIGVNDCAGCFKCCTDMGDSIILDPYDTALLVEGTGKSISQLIEEGAVELSFQDGLILPNLRMISGHPVLSGTAPGQPSGQAETACFFLNKEGRCSIHEYRPGFCRLFPLGRIYEEGSFKYFHQIYECAKKPETKVKIKKWLSVSDLARYEAYVQKWHDFTAELRKDLAAEEKKTQTENSSSQKDNQIRDIQLFVLKLFFMTPYDPGRDFYAQFERRLEAAKEAVLN